MFYDALLLLGLLFVAAIPVTVLFQITYESPRYPWLVGYFLTVSALFASWFWTHGGQTLGMKTWNLKLVRGDEQPVNWSHAILRFSLAVLPWLPLLVTAAFKFSPESRGIQILLWLPPLLAWATALGNRANLTWYDHFSGTRLTTLTKQRVETND